MALGVFWLSFEHTADEMQPPHLALETARLPKRDEANNAKSAFLANMSHEIRDAAQRFSAVPRSCSTCRPHRSKKPYSICCATREAAADHHQRHSRFLETGDGSSPVDNVPWNWPPIRARQHGSGTLAIDRKRLKLEMSIEPGSAGMADAAIRRGCAILLNLLGMPSNSPKSGGYG